MCAFADRNTKSHCHGHLTMKLSEVVSEKLSRVRAKGALCVILSSLGKTMENGLRAELEFTVEETIIFIFLLNSVFFIPIRQCYINTNSLFLNPSFSKLHINHHPIVFIYHKMLQLPILYVYHIKTNKFETNGWHFREALKSSQSFMSHHRKNSVKSKVIDKKSFFRTYL